MRILHITSHLSVGGISSYVTALTTGLKQEGVDVFVASGGGALQTALERQGVPHFTVPLNTKNELHPKLIVALWFLTEIIREYKITHIHAHTRVSQVVAAHLSRFLPVTYVSTCHSFYRKKLLRRLFPAWGDKIVAISDPVREHLVNDFKIPKTNIVLIPNGIDLTRYHEKLNDYDKTELKKYYGLERSNFVVGSVSKIEKSKGYYYLMQAIPQVLKRYPKTKFVFIGDGKYKKHLIAMARRLKVERNILFPGRLEDISFFLEVIDLFVLPSVWAEGFGLSILEAMAFGKAVVATNTGSTYTLVKDGENGLLVPPKDSAALSEAIIHLMEHPELLEQMRRKSLQIARGEYALDSIITHMRTLYAETIPADALAHHDEMLALVSAERDENVQTEETE